jgi:uncharacterized lipoprotein YajG
MKKLFLISLTLLTTISLMTSCGEKSATENATPNATECATDSATTNATETVKDSTSIK